MLYRELNTVGGYLSPACGGGKITSTQFFLIDKGILQWCAKGIVVSQFGCVLFPRRKRGNNTQQQPFFIIGNTRQNREM